METKKDRNMRVRETARTATVARKRMSRGDAKRESTSNKRFT